MQCLQRSYFAIRVKEEKINLDDYSILYIRVFLPMKAFKQIPCKMADCQP